MKLSSASRDALLLVCFLAWTGQAARSGPPAQVDAVEQHMGRARAAFGRQEFREARSELNIALSLAKGSSEAYFLRARINRLEGKLDDALKDIKTSLAHKPGDTDAQVLYARLLFETGDRKEARKQLATTLSLTASDPVSFLLKGDMDIGDGNHQAAIESYGEAIRLLPKGDSGTSVIRMRLEAVRNRQALQVQPFCYSNKGPIPLNRPRPDYTDKARANRTQGIVTLALLVSENGAVVYFIVFSGLKDGLTGEAVKAARRIKFKPALRDGNPVPCLQVVEVEFNLAYKVSG